MEPRARTINFQAFATAMLILLVAVLVLAAWQLVFVLMLTFAGVLLAILLRNTACLIARWTPLPVNAAVGLVIVVFLGLLVAFAYFAGPNIAAEGAAITKVLPKAWAEVQAALNGSTWGSYLLDSIPAGDGGPDLNLVGALQGTVSTTLGIAVNLVVVLSLAIYLALEPGLYRSGAQHLVPKRHRARSGEILDTLGEGLWRWMLGQGIDMLAVGVLIGAGLWLLGIPLPIALGVIAGLTNFIPYVGPFLGAAPAVVIAFADEPILAIWAAVLFFVVQQLDAQVIMPVIQKRVTSMPPALTILVVVAAGSLFGLLGILLATPFLLVILTLVQLVYVEDVLEDHDVEEGVA